MSTELATKSKGPEPLKVVLPGGVEWWLSKSGPFRVKETPFMKFRTLDVEGFNRALEGLGDMEPGVVEVLAKTIFDMMPPKILGQAAKYLLAKGDEYGEVEVLIKWGLHRKTNAIVLGVPKQECSGCSVDAEDEELAEMFGTNGVRQMGTIHTHPSECVIPSSTDVKSWTEDDAGLHFIIGRPYKKGSPIVPMAAYMTVLGESMAYHKASGDEPRQIALVDAPPEIFWKAHDDKDLITTWATKSYKTSADDKKWWDEYYSEWDAWDRKHSSIPLVPTPPPTDPDDTSKMDRAQWMEWAAKNEAKLSRKQRKKYKERLDQQARRQARFDAAREAYIAGKEDKSEIVVPKPLDGSLFSEAEYQAKETSQIIRGVGSGNLGRFETLKDARDIMAGRHGNLVQITPAEFTAMYGEIYNQAYDAALDALSGAERAYRGGSF